MIMVAVRRSTVIEAPISQVWDILRDYNGHDSWHPAVEKSSLESGMHTDQIGAVRNFKLTGGEHLREQLLSMSDKDHRFRYSIVESDIPLTNYLAEIELKPVTDCDWTFWTWSSKFDTPAGREEELSELVAKGVYEAGFESLRTKVKTNNNLYSRFDLKESRTPIEGTAMIIDHYGTSEEFHQAKLAAPPPEPGQVRLKQTAIGVNFIDVYCRTGYFKLLTPPGVIGMEAAGEVIDTGPQVNHLKPGQRVGYACPPLGAYTSVRTMDADLVFPLPDYLDDATAAAGLLKGITAEFLLHRVHQVRKGETVLIYAPAGGVGRILCQWANHLGATVIGATSSEEKAHIARAAGAQHVILPGETSLEDQIRKITKGHGADVIYDAVGQDSFAHSVAALAPRGHLISHGQASGDVGSWDISSLASCSATVSRPNYIHYTDTPEKLSLITERLFKAIESRIINIEIGQRYPLSEAALAHRDLENRQTTGSTILIP